LEKTEHFAGILKILKGFMLVGQSPSHEQISRLVNYAGHLCLLF
jgi:hypothetical protein